MVFPTLVYDWFVPGQWNWFAFCTCCLEPGRFSNQNFSKSLFWCIAEGRAILKVRYIGNISFVLFAIEDVDVVVFHINHTLANKLFSPSTSGPTLEAAS